MNQGQAQWADNSLITSFLKKKINPVVPIPMPVSAPTTAVPSHRHDVPECAAGYRCAQWHRVWRSQAGSHIPLVCGDPRTDIQRVQHAFN